MTSENKMYEQRPKKGNIPVIRYCNFKCVYCAFQHFTKISPCDKCRAGENHSHMEVLQRTPPKTNPGEFLTIGLSGDMSFLSPEDLCKVFEYCKKWKNRTFVIQSKDPECFLSYRSKISQIFIPNNAILGTTIETNRFGFMNHNETDNTFNSTGYRDYAYISSAPATKERYEAMVKLKCKKSVTIEPILSFDSEILTQWIKEINPEFVYVGYLNDRHEGKKLKLPEPSLEKTMQLITGLRDAGLEVREKTLRKAWWE